MHPEESPELVDWNEEDTRRFFGFIPAIAIGAAFGNAFASAAFAHNFCYPRSFYGYRDYYTCSPKYICQPAPYWAGPGTIFHPF